MLKFIRIILGIGLVGLAAYFLLAKGNNFSYKLPDLDLGQEKMSFIASTTADYLKNKTQSFLTGIGDTFQNTTQEIINSATDQAKNYAYNALKEQIEKGLETLGEKAGVNISSADNPTQGYIAYSIKQGVSAYFTIKNSEDESIQYNVDWLDGKIESGQLIKKDDSIILTHRWSKAGDYPVVFKIKTSKVEKDFKISIVVID